MSENLARPGVALLSVLMPSYGFWMRRLEMETPLPCKLMAGALVVLGVVIWTAIVLRKRFGNSPELSKARVLLHAIVGTQILLGLAAYWSRLTTADAPQPMPVMIWLTVIHTVFGAILFAFSVLIVLLCYRIIPRGGRQHATMEASLDKKPVTIG